MEHEIFSKSITVTECEENFNTIYEKEYFPKELLNEIREANVLLLPTYLKKEKVEGYVYPESTQEFLEYIKDNSPETLRPDIAIDDDGFKILQQHSATITIATILVDKYVLPILLSILANFLYDQAKKMHRNRNDLSTKIDIIATEEKDKRSKRISYEGPASEVEEALRPVIKEIFKDDSKRD